MVTRPAPTSRPLALSLTVFGALMRLVPHPWNFTPVGGTALYAGARMPGWLAYALPVLMLLVTDPILNAWHGYPAFSFTRGRLVVFGCFLVNVMIGRLLLRNSESLVRTGAAALLCSGQFFLVTNFATWALGTLYPKTVAGLMACYAAAIPFFGGTLFGDLFYATLLVGLHAWLGRRLSVTA